MAGWRGAGVVRVSGGSQRKWSIEGVFSSRWCQPAASQGGSWCPLGGLGG